jgi:O-antigen/teichoic acid export membrane protein
MAEFGWLLMKRSVRRRQETSRFRRVQGLALQRLHALLNHTRALEGMYLGAQVLGTVASVVIARSVGPAGRGSIITLVVWAQLLGWISAFSLDKAIVVLSRSSTARAIDPDGALAWSRRMVTMLSVPVAILCLVLGRHLFHDWVWSIYLVIGSLATAHGELNAGWLLAKKRMVGFILYRLAQPTLYFAGCTLVALLLHSDSTQVRVTALAVATVISLVVPVVLVFFITPWRIRTRIPGNGLFRFAASAQVANAMQYLNSRLDIVSLSLLASPREVGLYSVGYATGQATVLLGSAGIIRGITGRATKLDRGGVLATALLGCLIALFSPIVIPLVFGQAFTPSIRVAQIIALGGAISYAMQSVSGRLLGAGRPWLMALAEGCGAVAFGIGIAISRQIDVVALSSVASFAVSLAVAQLCLAKIPHTDEFFPSELPEFPE